MAKKSVKDQLYKQFEDDKSVVIGLDSKTPYFINSGHYALNMALSGRWLGGWGSGMVAEIFGESSTGKSLLSQRVMISMQRKEVYANEDCAVDLADTFILLDDVEKRYNEEFCTKQGMDITDVIKFHRTLTVEEHFKQMEDKVIKIRKLTHNSPLMVLCDSISQLTTEGEMDNGMDKVDMQKAKKIHQAMRLYSDFIASNKVLYMACSHVTAGMNAYGPKRVVKGGSGLAFQSSTRLDLKYLSKFIRNELETIDAGMRGEVFGVRVFAEAVKNSIIAPFKFAILDIYFDYCIDPYSGLLDYFIREGRVTVKPAEKKVKEEAKEETGKKKKKSDKNVIYILDGKYEMTRETLPQVVIDNDVLGVKAAGYEYMKPINFNEVVVEEEIDSGEMTPPPPPKRQPFEE
jgi:RecA/RadA recombinase